MTGKGLWWSIHQETVWYSQDQQIEGLLLQEVIEGLSGKLLITRTYSGWLSHHFPEAFYLQERCYEVINECNSWMVQPRVPRLVIYTGEMGYQFTSRVLWRLRESPLPPEDFVYTSDKSNRKTLSMPVSGLINKMER